MDKSKAQPGNIVKFTPASIPLMPSTQLRHNVESGEMLPGVEFAYWDGFKRGIIAHVEDQGRVVYLYAYDNESHSIYLDNKGFPVRLQFHVDELILVQEAGDFDSLVKDRKV